jgi:hypothetical protein
MMVKLVGRDTKKSTNKKLSKTGIRYFDINLCKGDDDNTVICNTSTSWSSLLQQIFTFSKESVEQFFILNINTEEDKKELESAITNIYVVSICLYFPS